jgi:hypothetical protein
MDGESMSESDLRPPERQAPRADHQAAPSSGSKWWEPLATKWGLIGLLIFIGLAIGVVQGWFDSLSGKNDPKNAELIKAKNAGDADAALRPAIDAFYAKPTDETERAAKTAIENYRRSLPNDPSTKRLCAEGMPVPACKEIEDRQKQLPNAVMFTVRKNFPDLLRQNLTLRANITEALARHQRVQLDQATNWIFIEFQRTKYEKDIADQINWYMTTREHIADNRSIRDFFRSYLANAAYSFAPLFWYDKCPPQKRPPEPPEPEIQFCIDGVKKYEDAIANYRGDPLKRSYKEIKYAAIKMMLEERVVPRDFLESKVVQDR